MATDPTGPHRHRPVGRDHGRLLPAAAGISGLCAIVAGSFTTFGSPGLGLLAGAGVALGGTLMVQDARHESRR